MGPVKFGAGSVGLRWTGVEGIGGLQTQLAIRGTLDAKGYGIGAVVQLAAEITAWDEGSAPYGALGTTLPQAFVLNWLKQQFIVPNPPSEDETSSPVNLQIPMAPDTLERLEQRREGRAFQLQIDTTIVLVDAGRAIEGEGTRDQAGGHPMYTGQDWLSVSREDWAGVLQQWERGMGVSILVPLPIVEPSPERGDVVRRLAVARQRIDAGDYQGAFIECRQVLELLRQLSRADPGAPKDVKSRSVPQRVHAVLNSLHTLASAAFHTDEAIRDFVPGRADAVALTGATASMAQQVFALLDRG